MSNIDQVFLAKQMLKWLELKQALEGVEYSIKEQVLAEGKTVVIAGVRAKYSKGSTSYNYKEAVMAAHKRGDPNITDELFRRVAEAKVALITQADSIAIDILPSPQYTAIAKEYKLEVQGTTSEPSVTVSIDTED